MPQDQTDAAVMTVSELAVYLRIGRNTAYALCRSQDFPAIRVGKQVRVALDALNEWLRSRRTGS